MCTCRIYEYDKEVVYGDSSSRICGGAMRGATESHVSGSDVTGSDVSHVTGRDVSHVPCPEVCYAHALPEVAQYPP